jgi:glycosyltransferase involved in cell wall biosynthesis
MSLLPPVAVDARYVKLPFSGIARHTQNLMYGLAAQEDEAPVAVLVNSQTLLDEGVLGRPSIVAVEAPGSPMSQWSQLRLARSLRRRGVRLLHSPDVFGPLVAPGLRRVVTLADVIPLVCREQLRKSRKSRFSWAWRWWLRAQCAAADAVVTVSRHSADDICRELKVAPAKVHVIHNSITFGEAAPTLTVRENPSHRHEEPTILYVGRRDPYKNLVGLVRAFAHVRQQVTDARLVIVGDSDPRYRDAEDEASRLGLNSAVRFTGFAGEEELQRRYRSAVLFAFPSLYEGFGLPPLEAMLYGVPVVSSDRTCLPEVLGDAALLVDPESPEAFGEAMVRVLTDRTLVATLR